jgi:NodT family efflux transporter outer membrane factor (OMF) lipoprotein
MKVFKIYTYTTILTLLILCLGCKTQLSKFDIEQKSMPTSYSEKSDSINSANIKWKDFFLDKNLVALIDTGLTNNFDVLMTLQKIEVARNDLRLSKGAMLPSVNGNFSYLQRKFGYYTMDDAGNRVTEIRPGQLIPTHLPDYLVGLQANWEIDIWGKLRNKKKSAFTRYLGSVEGVNLVKTNFISEVANTYYELIALDVELDIIDSTIKIRENVLEIYKVQKQAGLANELAVKQIEAQVLNAQSLAYELLQKIKENENKLNFLLGRFPQIIVRDKLSFNTQFAPIIKAGLPSHLLKNRPDIKKSEYDLLASKMNVKAAKAAFYPSFAITGNAGFQSFNTEFLFSSPQSIAYGVLGNLTAPLINRSAIKAQFNNAKAYQLEALYQYQKTILNAYIEVANELSNIQNLENIYELKSKEVAMLDTSIDIASDLFKSGRANYFEVLMTQSTALQSKLELVTAKKRQYNASVNIYKALGGGWQ